MILCFSITSHTGFTRSNCVIDFLHCPSYNLYFLVLHYLFWIGFILYLIAPFIVLPLVNTLLAIRIVYVMKNSRKLRAGQNERQPKPEDIRIAVSQIVISIYHFICISSDIYSILNYFGIIFNIHWLSNKLFVVPVLRGAEFPLINYNDENNEF